MDIPYIRLNSMPQDNGHRPVPAQARDDLSSIREQIQELEKLNHSRKRVVQVISCVTFPCNFFCCMDQIQPDHKSQICMSGCSPYPCIECVVDSCNSPLKVPEDSIQEKNTFYLGPQRQSMDLLVQKKEQMEARRHISYMNPREELNQISARRDELDGLSKTRKKVACYASACCFLTNPFCCLTALPGISLALFGPLRVRRDEPLPAAPEVKPNCDYYYTRMDNFETKSPYDFWRLAISPIPCITSLFNLCKGSLTPEEQSRAELRTQWINSHFYLFSSEKKEIDQMQKKIEEAEKFLPIQPFVDGVRGIKGIVDLTLDMASRRDLKPRASFSQSTNSI